MLRMSRRSRRERGAALIAVTLFTAIAAVLIAGVSSFAISHATRARTDAAYAAALDAAEAGINSKFRLIAGKIGSISADDMVTEDGTLPSGGAYSVTGTIEALDGFGRPSQIAFVSAGTVDGVTRRVRADVHVTASWTVPYTGTGTYPVLLLTGMPSPDPDSYRVWRMRNTHDFAVRFKWNLYGTPRWGYGLWVPARSDFYFIVVGAVPGEANTLKTYIDGAQSGIDGGTTLVTFTHNQTSGGHMTKASNPYLTGPLPEDVGDKAEIVSLIELIPASL